MFVQQFETKETTCTPAEYIDVRKLVASPLLEVSYLYAEARELVFDNRGQRIVGVVKDLGESFKVCVKGQITLITFSRIF